MVGVKDRDTNRVRAQVVSSTDKATLQEFVWDNTQTGSTVYTDDAGVYQGLPDLYFHHESVKYSVAEYVRDQLRASGRYSSAPTWARSTSCPPST